MEEKRLYTCLLSSGLAVNEVEVEGRGGGGVGQSRPLQNTERANTNEEIFLVL